MVSLLDRPPKTARRPRSPAQSSRTSPLFEASSSHRAGGAFLSLASASGRILSMPGPIRKAEKVEGGPSSSEDRPSQMGGQHPTGAASGTTGVRT
jgi:hypothetical protein